MAKRYRKNGSQRVALGIVTGLLAVTVLGLVGHITNEKTGWVDDLKTIAYSVNVNDEKVEVEKFKDGENKYCFKIQLEVGDEMTTYYLGQELTLADSEETIFTCVTTGEHSVYVNDDNQVWIVEPTLENSAE